MCTRQRTPSLKSFSLGNMQDKAYLVLDLRESRPRHQVTAQGVPGQDAKQLVRLVAGKSQLASGPMSQRTRRRGWWWRRRSHRQIRRQKTTSLCLKVSKELWQGGKGGDSTQTLQLHGHLGKLSSSYVAMVTACNTLTNHKPMYFSKAASPTDAGRTSLFLSPVRVDLQLVFPLRQLSMLAVHDTKGQYQIDRSISKSTSTGRTGFQQAMTLSRSNTVSWQKKAGRQIGLQQYRWGGMLGLCRDISAQPPPNTRRCEGWVKEWWL